jgi:hypothetical protein
MIAVAMAALLAGALSACSTAPPAAIVNGQAISVPQLDRWLQGWASSAAYNKAEDAVFYAQAEQSYEAGNTSPNLYTVVARTGAGTGPDVFGTFWAAIELSNLITALAVHEHLEHLGEAPTAVELDAAWQAEYSANPALWGQLSPTLRLSGAEQDADRALVNGPVAKSSTDAAFYKKYKAHFWSQVCVATANVTVPGPGGGVDMAASLKEADQVASELSGHPSPGAAPVTGGGRFCDSPAKFIEMSSNFQTQVGAAPVGQATVLTEKYGYEVVEVRSRTVIPYNKETAADIDIVATGGGSQNPPTGDKTVIDILAASDVKVNPAYGTWSSVDVPGCAPQVLALATAPCTGSVGG